MMQKILLQLSLGSMDIHMIYLPFECSYLNKNRNKLLVVFCNVYSRIVEMPQGLYCPIQGDAERQIVISNSNRDR